jgi:hypothetical protein
MFMLEKGREANAAGVVAFAGGAATPGRFSPNFPGTLIAFEGSSTVSSLDSGLAVPCGNFLRTPVALLGIADDVGATGCGEGGGVGDRVGAAVVTGVFGVGLAGGAEVDGGVANSLAA